MFRTVCSNTSKCPFFWLGGGSKESSVRDQECEEVFNELMFPSAKTKLRRLCYCDEAVLGGATEDFKGQWQCCCRFFIYQKELA